MIKEENFLKEIKIKNLKFLRILITCVSLIIAEVYLLFPEVRIDSLFLILLLIALAPWLTPFFKSIELPGGLKFEIDKFDDAADRAEAAGLLKKTVGSDTSLYFFQTILTEDPNLALAGLRIEIEKQLHLLAEYNQVRVSKAGIGILLSELSKQEVLNYEEQAALKDIVGILNSAVHGASVQQDTANKVVEVGVKLLLSIESKYKKN